MSMETWAEELLSQIFDEAKRNVGKWSSIINTLGLTIEQRDQWVSIYKKNVEVMFNEMTEDVENKQNQLITSIEDLLEKITHVCKTLELPIPSCSPLQNNLYGIKIKLKNNLGEFETKLSERRLQLQLLRDRELELCKMLGEMCSSYDEDSLMPEKEFETYTKCIDDLETLKFTRMEEFCDTRQKLIDIIEEIKYKPKNQFETIICEREDEFLLTTENFKTLDNFLNKLTQIKCKLSDKIGNLRTKVQELCAILDEDVHEMNKFLNENNSNTLECASILQSEIDRLHKLKLLNIQTFIQKLRVEIQDFWDKCHYTDEQRQQFQYMKANCYTEDLLSLHDIELAKLKKYHKDNQQVFTLLKRYDELTKKARMLESTQKADRLKNRAGQLLHEERERNKIAANIPKVEEQLVQMANKYAEEHDGTPFLTFGQKIVDLISQYHDECSNEKRLRAMKRKINALSPVNNNHQDKMSVYNPHPSTSTTKITSLKKMKLSTKENENKAMTAPGKLGYKVRKRLSEQRSKKMKNVRKNFKEMHENKNRIGNIADTTEYDDFQENITENWRSTMHMVETSPLATPLPVTPSRATVSRQLTPARVVVSSSKSPNSKSKLSASSLKLLF